MRIIDLFFTFLVSFVDTHSLKEKNINGPLQGLAPSIPMSPDARTLRDGDVEAVVDTGRALGRLAVHVAGDLGVVWSGDRAGGCLKMVKGASKGKGRFKYSWRTVEPKKVECGCFKD